MKSLIFFFVVFLMLGFCESQEDGVSAADIFRRARELFEMGKLIESRQLFQYLVERVQLPNIFIALSVIEEQLQNRQEALNILLKGRELHPNDMSLHLYICRFLGRLTARLQADFFKFEDVLNSCYEYLKHDPRSFDVYNILGAVYGGWRKYDIALQHYHISLSLLPEFSPEYFEILENMVLLELRAGELEDAIAHANLFVEHKAGRYDHIYPHITTIAKPGDRRAGPMLKEHVTKFIADCPPTEGCQKTSKYNILWTYQDIKKEEPFYIQNKGNILQGKLGDIIDVFLVNDLTFGQVFGQEIEAQYPPLLEGKEREDRVDVTHYAEHSVFEIRFQIVFLYGREALTRIGCTFLIGNYREWIPTEEMCIKTLPPPKLTELEIPNQEEEENTIILSTFPQFNPKNYFHFLIEGLTRFNIVWERYKREERERKERGERERGYRVLVQGGEMHASWEGVRREALELLGVDWDKIIEYNPDPNEITLVQSEYREIDWDPPPNWNAYSADTWSMYYVPKYALEKLRTYFHNLLKERKEEERERDTISVLYVARQVGQYIIRSISNQDVLIGALKKEALAQGATFSVHYGEERFIEQVKMFEKADVIIGPHGAGLGNSVFSRKGTEFILFPLKPRHDLTYEYMARALGFSITVLEKVTSFYYSDFGTLNKEQIREAVVSLRNSLKRQKDKHLRDEL